MATENTVCLRKMKWPMLCSEVSEEDIKRIKGFLLYHWNYRLELDRCYMAGLEFGLDWFRKLMAFKENLYSRTPELRDQTLRDNTSGE